MPGRDALAEPGQELKSSIRSGHGWIDSIASSDGINFKATNMEMAARATLGAGQQPLSVNPLARPGREQG